MMIAFKFIINNANFFDMKGRNWWLAMIAACTITFFGATYFMPWK